MAFITVLKIVISIVVSTFFLTKVAAIINTKGARCG
jgi:hypothetical protein